MGEKLRNNSIRNLKKIMAILLIIATIMPYFPTNVFAEDTAEEFNPENLINVYWKDNSEQKEGTTNDSFAFAYDITFNGISTGFKNVVLEITTDKVLNTVDTFTGSFTSIGKGYATRELGSVNSGRQISGEGSIKFGNEDQKLNRTVTFKLTGNYEDPKTGTTKNFTVTRNLNCLITPATKITPYNTELEWQKVYNNYTGKYDKIKEPYTNMAKSTSSDENNDYWNANYVYVTYPINIVSEELTQKLEYHVIINRTDVDNSNNTSNGLDRGLDINWGDLTKDFGEPTQTKLEDGSIEYIFTKGEDSDTLVESNTFKIDKNYTISITHTTPDTDMKSSNYYRRTVLEFNSTLIGTGFAKTDEFGKDPVIEKKNIVKRKNDTKYEYLNGSEPLKTGMNWVSYSYETNDVLTNEKLQDIKANNSVDISTYTKIKEYTNQGTDEGKTGYLTFTQPKLKYISDEGKFVTINLTENQLRLKQIKTNKITTSSTVNKININSQEYEFEDEFITGEGININKFTIEMPNHSEFKRTFDLDFTLSNLNLSETEVDNILGIEFEMSTSGDTCFGSGIAYVENKSAEGIGYPYYEFQTKNWDVTENQGWHTSTITLKMCKPEKEIWNNFDKTYVENVNPIFYIQLPDDFNYRFEGNSKTNSVELLNGNDKIEIDYSQLRLEKGKKRLVVPCIGTYSSKEIDNVTININIQKNATVSTLNTEKTINIYMVTDNEIYPTNSYAEINKEQFKNSKKEIANKYIHWTSKFSYIGIKDVKTVTIAKIGADEIGNISDDTVDDGEKQNPKIVESNSVFSIRSTIIPSGQTVKNIEIISNLPYVNNTEINSTQRLIEDNYTLPSEFVTKKANSLKGITDGEPVPQISLKNVKFKGVYVKESDKKISEVSSDKYTLYYTTQSNANFDSDNSVFQEYVEGTDLSTAKSLKVVLNEDYELLGGYSLYLEYEAVMPDEAGMVGAISGMKFTRTSDNLETVLQATPVYLINGTTSGDIVITKKFEDCADGVAPEGVNFNDIQFKLYVFDDGEKVYIKGTDGNDLIVSANEKGVAKFENLDPNDVYYIEEITNFDKYEGIEDSGAIILEEGEAINFKIVNKLKRGTIVVNKKWEGASGIPATATLKITRNKTSDSDLNYSATVKTNEKGVAIFTDVPYGEYTITEIDENGWVLKEEKIVTLDSEEIETEVENQLSKGTVKILKKMNENDTVDGLSFHITGRGQVVVKGTDGNYINTDLDVKIKIGKTDAQNEITVNEGQLTNDNIKIEKLDNDSSALITLTDVYVGRYEAEEVDIPLLEDGKTPKYIANSDSETLVLNGQTITLNITNRWKTGTLKIVKTAEEGVELKGFKVRVKSDKTYYGSTYNKVFEIPESGILTINNLYLGNYTVEEEETEHFTPKYGSEKSNDPVTVEVKEDEVTTTEIYNESTYGYVRVLKTLENKEADETKGIKFRLYGKDAIGNDVDEIKEITETIEYEGKTYGTILFGPVQSGGEYLVEEVEESVPDYYIVADSISVDIKKTNTESDPVILSFENKRGIGNLEITTKTNPEGGDLTGITYDVTEVKLTDTTYEKIGETTHLTSVAGFSEMRNINSGLYVVEQSSVPNGYIKDYPQIVEVPIKDTGYAEFEIEKPEMVGALLTVEKELVNSNGEIATDDDIEKAELNKNESFEAIIKNINENKIYYVFFSVDKPGKLKGLPEGTYEINEVYKPKYVDSEYLIKNGDEYVSMEENKSFTVTEDTTEVGIKIKNKINTNFGFGGQDPKDNYAKTSMDELNKTTKTIIYISGENGEVVTGAQFKIYNSNGNEVSLSFENNTYVVNNDKRLIIYGLPVGKYTIKSVGDMPEGYEKPNDKVFNVYEKATVITRISIMKVKSRGKSLTLSTKYVDENGEKQFVPRSKYKILEPNSGTVLKFEKDAVGNYYRSNSASASETISLRKGSVVVTGIEVGKYQLGIVDLSSDYGFFEPEPASLNVTENSVIEKEVMVDQRGGVKKVAAFDNYGYFLSISNTGMIFTTETSVNGTNNELKPVYEVQPSLISVRAKDIAYLYRGTSPSSTDLNSGRSVIVDKNGKVWTNFFGSGSDISNCSEITWNTEKFNTPSYFPCISDISGSPLNGVKIEKVYSNYTNSDYGSEVYAISENGEVYRWGYTEYGIGKNTLVKTPQNISSNTILNGKKIVQIACDGYHKFAIDDTGKVYYWGQKIGVFNMSNDVEQPICLTDMANSGLSDIKVKYINIGYNNYYFIDYNGNLWSSGYDRVSLGLPESDTRTSSGPMCISKMSNDLKGKKIEKVYGEYNYAYAVDSNGKLYGWGKNNYNQLGVMEYGTNVYTPICINDDEKYKFDNLKIKDIYASSNGYSYAIDENSNLWFWGLNNSKKAITGRENGSILPEKIDFPQNAYFDLFEVANIYGAIGNDESIGVLDKTGELWKVNNSSNPDSFAEQFKGTENGANMGDITIKDYVFQEDNNDTTTGAVVGTNGELWTFGLINEPYVYDDAYTNKSLPDDYRKYLNPICLTSNKNCVLYNKKIVSVASDGLSYSFSMAVIDEDGKIYTAGQKNSSSGIYNLGYPAENRTANNGVSAFQCLNDKYSNLENIKFKKVCISYQNTMVALDEDGHIWSWGWESSELGTTIPAETYQVDGRTCYAPTMLTQGDLIDEKTDSLVKIVDIASYSGKAMALDDNGNMYVWGEVSTYFSDNYGVSSVPRKVDKSQTNFDGKNIVKIGMVFDERAVLTEDGSIYIGNKWNSTQYGITAKDMYCTGNGLYIKTQSQKNNIIKITETKTYDSSSSSYKYTYNITGNECYNKRFILIKDAKYKSSNGNTSGDSSTDGKDDSSNEDDKNYNKLTRAIDSNTVTGLVNQYEKLFLFDDNGTLTDSMDINVRTYAAKSGYTIIIDYYNNLWYKTPTGTTLTKYNDATVNNLIYSGQTYAYFTDSKNNLCMTDGKTVSVCTGFDSNTKITNIIEGDYEEYSTNFLDSTKTDITPSYKIMSVYAQDENNNLWTISGGTKATKITSYQGGKIEEARFWFVKDSENKLWQISGISATLLLENVKSFTFDIPKLGTPLLTALDYEGNLYTQGMVKNEYAESKWYQLGGTVENVGTSAVLNLSEQGIGKVKLYKSGFITQDSYTEYFIIAVNESNEIYMCIPGSAPIKLQNVTDKNIVSTYGNAYLVDSAGNKISLVDLRYSPSYRTLKLDGKIPDEGYTQKEGYIEYNNGEIGIWDYSKNEYVKYPEKSAVYRAHVMMSIDDDGKLYKYINGINKTEIILSEFL